MLMTPIMKGLRVFSTWDKSITEIATSMGFLAASGMLTADMQGTMLDVMGDLPMMGMQVQGMLGALTTLFSGYYIESTYLLCAQPLGLVLAIFLTRLLS